MVTLVVDETFWALPVKEALVAPAATVTLAGIVAAAVLLLESDTMAPPVGAGPLSVTVPVEVLPPLTDVGFRASEDRLAADATGVGIHFQYHPPRKPEPASPRHPMLKVFVSFMLPSML